MYTLPPKIHPIIDRFIKEKDILSRTVDTYGGAAHFLFPDIFEENVMSFKKVFETAKVQGRICYAHKVNRSVQFVAKAQELGIDIDVASFEEFSNALACGFSGEQIKVTGIKSKEFLELAIQHDTVINVDSFEELSDIVSVVKEKFPTKKQGILIRLTAFQAKGYNLTSRVSRFGIASSLLPAVIKTIQENKDILNFLGFSFHIDTTEIREKTQALEVVLGGIDQAYASGLQPTMINIGGGFRQVFVGDFVKWNEYVESLKSSLQMDDSLVWPGTSFGYKAEGATVYGNPTFHRYFNEVAPSTQLNSLLEQLLLRDDGRTVANVVQDNLFTIVAEPGKGVVDGAGITAALVTTVKRLNGSDFLIGVTVKRDNVSAADQEIMIDPVVLYRGKEDTYEEGTFAVFFSGPLCLEKDMVTTHKTFLTKVPKAGDIIVFINTAAYQMDLSASSAMGILPPQKIAITTEGDSFRTTIDTPTKYTI